MGRHWVPPLVSTSSVFFSWASSTLSSQVTVTSSTLVTNHLLVFLYKNSKLPSPRQFFVMFSGNRSRLSRSTLNLWSRTAARSPCVVLFFWSVVLQMDSATFKSWFSCPSLMLWVSIWEGVLFLSLGIFVFLSCPSKAGWMHWLDETLEVVRFSMITN